MSEPKYLKACPDCGSYSKPCACTVHNPTPDSGAREWWIDQEPCDEEMQNVFDAFSEHPRQGPLAWQANLVHVIEHSHYQNLKEAFEYLISTLPEECTAGFVTHARAIASGDKAEIERTK